MNIHPTACVDPQASIDPTTILGPNVVISGPVQIGADCRIGPSAVIMGHTRIGDGCEIHSHAVIGDVPQDRAHVGGESYSDVRAGCVIREGVTIHRGTAAGSSTVVGRRCLLMTNSHIAHNCEVGDEVMLVSGALLGGYVQVGSRAIISGNAAIHQFVRIGELALVSGLAMVVQDVPPFFMTDRAGNVVCENRIGMMRAKLSPLERKEVKTAFRLIYRSGLGRSEAVEYLTANATSEAGRTLLDFFAADSKRGITCESGRRRRAA